MLRIWTEENVLIPLGGGSSGRHRVYPDGERIWAAIASCLHIAGIKGANLTAAVVALRSWNDSLDSPLVTDSGFCDPTILGGMTVDHVAIVRQATPGPKPTYRVVHEAMALDRLQEPHMRLSLAWLERLLASPPGSGQESVDGGVYDKV